MSFDPERHLDAAAATLGLTLTASQRPGVLRYLETAHAMWQTVAAAPIPADEAAQAARFVPGEWPVPWLPLVPSDTGSA